MDSIEVANNALYLYEYICVDSKKYNEIWNKLKERNAILKDSFNLVKNKFGE